MQADTSPPFWIALFLYGLAALLYGAYFLPATPAEQPRSSADRARALSPWVLGAAFLAHAGDISWRAIVDDMHPGSSVREALGFMAWGMVGLYLVAARRQRLGLLGPFVAPLALALLATARLTPGGEVAVGVTVLGRIHIALATLGVAVFAVATGIAIVYLLEERNLKRKKFEGLLFKSGVALASLDRLAHRMVLAGFPIFTVALMLGVIWVSQLSAGWDRPEYPLALVTWLSFGALIVSRTAWGWRGRRAALLTLVGFSAAALVLLLYFARRVM
ncbi:MAG TPA: cytochrome c biogenesis protein CcsA [Kofleriaceae bacterium]|jgi:ABC-type uncharacterized transport system permease subunit|nr:cytochrome c biogenesis protein CcsA [Kofleriaceae bacterium]